MDVFPGNDHTQNHSTTNTAGGGAHTLSLMGSCTDSALPLIPKAPFSLGLFSFFPAQRTTNPQPPYHPQAHLKAMGGGGGI